MSNIKHHTIIIKALNSIWGTHAQSQHALLPIYTINTQSVVLHEFVNELWRSVRVHQEREEGGELPSEGCLGSAASCLLS